MFVSRLAVCLYLTALVTLLILRATRGSSVSDLDKNLSSYLGFYISRGEKDTEYLDIALISHHLLFAYRSKSLLHRECWIAKSGHDELFAVNGVATQYKEARTFAVDQYGLLRLEPGGIQDIERSDGYPDYIIHWRRVSKAPNMAEIRLCER